MTHLDVDNVVQPIQKIRDRADNFVCQICHYIVLDPIECQSCDSVFCQTCIDQCQKDICPKKCDGDEEAIWGTMHRIMKAELNELEFKCVNEECGKVLEY